MFEYQHLPSTEHMLAWYIQIGKCTEYSPQPIQPGMARWASSCKQAPPLLEGLFVFPQVIYCPHHLSTIDIALDGAQEVLKDAARVIVTIKGRQTIEKEPTIDRGILSFSLTQEETAILGVGTVQMEVSILTVDGYVLKSNTIKTTIEAAIRRETMTF